MTGQLNLGLHDEVRAEERAARERQRRSERAARAAAKRSREQWQHRLAAAIIDTRSDECRCALRATMTRDDLVALGGGCTDERWVCPRLDRVRRRMGL